MKIAWNEQEAEMLSRMPIPFDFKGNLTNDQISDLYEIVPDYMLDNTGIQLDPPDKEAMMCEHLIDRLAAAMKPLGLI